MKEIVTIEIPQYITKVKLSEKRRAKYYKQRKGKRSKKISWYPRNLPKTFQKRLNDKEYSISKKGYLLDENNKKVIANPRSAGTPNYEKLSGNSFASGYGSPIIRANLVKGLKEFYRPFVAEMGQINNEDYPLWVDWHLYTTIPKRMFDLSNFWFYYKYFEDCLFEWYLKDEKGKILAFNSEEKALQHKNKRTKKTYTLIPPVIPDDNIKYVTKPGTAPILTPIENWKDRKFVFKIYKDERECLNNNDLWK